MNDFHKLNNRSLLCSPYLRYPPYTVKWWPTDTEEQFKENLKDNRLKIKLQHYIDNPISYKINRFYCRVDDLDFNPTKPGNIFLGCSHTFGIGHHLENTWSYRLNKEIGGEYFNLSVPGTGIQHGYMRLLLNLPLLINVKNLFIYYPHHYRFMNVNEHVETLGVIFPHNVAASILKDPNTYNQNYTSPLYTYIIYSAFLRAIDNICRKNNIDCYFLPSYPIVPFPDTSLIARDTLHFSVASQDAHFNAFLEAYNSKRVLNVEEDFKEHTTTLDSD